MALVSAAVDRFAVAYAGQAEQIGRQLRAAGMEDEGSAHAEHAAEQAGFEDDIVPRRGLAGARLGGAAAGVVQSSWAKTKAAKSTSRVSSSRRSSVVVPGLKTVVQGSTCATSSRPRVSASQQLRLLSRRAQEYARLVHPARP